jgi:tetratricopeptide (TPR) repeat protein
MSIGFDAQQDGGAMLSFGSSTCQIGWMFTGFLFAATIYAQTQKFEPVWPTELQRIKMLMDQRNDREAGALVDTLMDKETAPEIRGMLLYWRGVAWERAGERAKAEKAYQSSLKVLSKALGERHWILVRPLAALATLYTDLHRPKLAREIFREADALDYTTATREDRMLRKHTAAIILHTSERRAEAEVAYRDVLSESEQMFGPNSKELSSILNNLGVLLTDLNKLSEAASMLNRSRDILVNLGGSWPARLTLNLAELEFKIGDYVRAEGHMQEAMDAIVAVHGGNHPDLVHVLDARSKLLKRLGRSREADSAGRRRDEIARGYRVHTVDRRELESRN